MFPLNQKQNIFKYFYYKQRDQGRKELQALNEHFSRSRRVRFAWAMGSMVLVSMRLVKSNPKTWD